MTVAVLTPIAKLKHADDSSWLPHSDVVEGFGSPDSGAVEAIVTVGPLALMALG